MPAWRGYQRREPVMYRERENAHPVPCIVVDSQDEDGYYMLRPLGAFRDNQTLFWIKEDIPADIYQISTPTAEEVLQFDEPASGAAEPVEDPLPNNVIPLFGDRPHRNPPPSRRRRRQPGSSAM